MTSRKVLLSYFEVASSLNVLSKIEFNETTNVLQCYEVNNRIKVYLDLSTYENKKDIYINIKKYLKDDCVERIETTRCLFNLNGNELEHFNLILTEINKLNKLFNNYNY